MIRYPKTPRLNKVDVTTFSGTAVVSEKLDGANAGISFSESGELLLQSRGHILRGGSRERQFDLFKQLGASLRDDLYSTLGTRYLLFGEWLYATHRVYYDALPGFFVTYDLYDKERDFFLTTEERSKILGDLLPSAPLIHRGPVKKINSFAKFIAKSHFKSRDWKANFRGTAERMGLEPPWGEIDDSDLMEGVYVKVESERGVEGRLKVVRPEFEKIRDDHDDWMRKPLFPNSCQ